MKPGNLSERMLVPNPAATRDEDSIIRTSGLRCAVFFLEKKGIKNHGKKTFYI